MTKPVLAVSANTSWALTNYRMNLIKELQHAGFEVCALVPADEGVAKLAAAGVKVYPLPLYAHGTAAADELRLLLRYVSLLWRLRPAAFLGFTIKPNVYGGIAGALASVPVINNITGLGQAFLKHGTLRWLVSKLYGLSLRRSKRVFFQNRDSLELFLSLGLVRETQVGLLPGSGVDLDHFRPAAKRHDTDFVFLLPSRLIREKGIAEFCVAAAAVRKVRARARFKLLGPVEASSNKSAIDSEQIGLWERECGIEYLGATDDVRTYFAEADCIVLPSYYPEGVPRALIEAAAMGKPIITTDTPGCREVVDDGENGFLCEPQSSNSLVQAMLRVLDLTRDEREEMSTKARQKAEGQFDEQAVISAYLQVLQSVT